MSRQSVRKCLFEIVARHRPHPLLPPTSLSLRRQCLHYGIAGCYREKPHHSLRGSHLKPVSVRVLVSVLWAHPLNLTFAVFELPGELILSILSHISPVLIGYYARFRVQDELAVYDDHLRRMRVLRWLTLSMTCKTMRWRLLLWILERLDIKKPIPYNWSSGESARGSTPSSMLYTQTHLWPIA